MRRFWLPLALLLALSIAWLPTVSYTEDQDAILLARTIYALARDESYDTKLAIGTVVMNRVDSAWFGDSLTEVLTEHMQFPQGNRYDDDCLQAAHAVLSGTRTLDRSALYYQSIGAAEPYSEKTRIASVGGYAFYTSNGRL